MFNVSEIIAFAFVPVLFFTIFNKGKQHMQLENHFKDSNKNFKNFKDYVTEFWRPACDIYITVLETSQIYNWLNAWFEFLEDPKLCKKPPKCIKQTIQSFINITPYGKFDMGLNKNGVQVWEFLFVDEGINHKQLTKIQLTI